MDVERSPNGAEEAFKLGGTWRIRSKAHPRLGGRGEARGNLEGGHVFFKTSAQVGCDVHGNANCLKGASITMMVSQGDTIMVSL